MKRSLQNIVSAIMGKIGHGLVDSLSLHKTLKVLVNAQCVRETTGKCLAANAILLLGSILVYEKGISPGIQLMSTVHISHDSNSILDLSVYSIYHGIWVLPVLGFCYSCSLVWYQEIADETYLHLKGPLKKQDAKNSTNLVLQSVYSLLVWLVIFVSVHVFSSLSPFLINYARELCLSLYVYSNSLILNLFVHTTYYILQYLSFTFQCFGFLILSFLYGWYGFDYGWISDGYSPEHRFALLEDNWAYFVGFGLPYAILVKSTSFFVGYALYLMLFPFCIILCFLADKELSKSSITGPIGDFDASIPPTGIMSFAQSTSNKLLQFVDKKAKFTKSKKAS